MPAHVDTTANVERTSEELLRVQYSLAGVDSVIDGYPELNRRLYVPLHEELEIDKTELHGRQVNIVHLPPGYDATLSGPRIETINNIPSEELLHGTPDPDLPTGEFDWHLEEDSKTVTRALRDRCRDFTQHLQPLVPGWKQLLALTTGDDRPLGMPTGIGWYTHYWLSDMCDGTTFRLSESGDDLEVLLYPRPGNEQSQPVWATPGGYVVKADTEHPDMTPLQAASARRAEHWAQRDISRYGGIAVKDVKYPISSGNTLVAGLRTTAYARFIHDPNHREEPVTRAEPDPAQREPGFVSLHTLAEFNPAGGIAGDETDNPWPIWTTHFEYVVAGLRAVTDPEHQHILGMRKHQLERAQTVFGELQGQYPMLKI